MVILSDEVFGQYYKKIRSERKITQDYVAKFVNRKKMTISLIESGKNDPPEGELLLGMINALGNVDDDIKSKLIVLSSKVRNTIPVDISNYFLSNLEIYNAIKRGLNMKMKNDDWKKIFSKE